MKFVVIGFSSTRHTNLFSCAISLIMDKPYSHVYVKYYSEKLERNLIYQASGLKVNFCNVQDFVAHNSIYSEYMLKVTEEQYTKLMQKSIDLVGSSYSLMEVFGLGFVKILDKFGIRRKNPVDEARKWFCSELVGELLVEINFISKDHPRLNNLTPKDIEDILLSRTEDGKL